MKTLLTGIVIFFSARMSAAEFGDNVQLRGSLANSRLQFERAKIARVAFMSGLLSACQSPATLQ